MYPTKYTVSANTINPTMYPFYNPFEPTKKLEVTLSTETDTDSPYITSVNSTYSYPSIGIYKNLNADPKVRKRVTKYFYFKVLEVYLFNELSYILNFLKHSNGKVKKKRKNIKKTKNKDKLHIQKKKTEYIEKFVLDKKHIYKLLDKFTTKYKVNWFDLIDKHEEKLIDKIGNMLVTLF